MSQFKKGPSIYDVHTEEGGGQVQVDACGRGEGPAPYGRPHRKLKLESTQSRPQAILAAIYRLTAPHAPSQNLK